MDLILGNLNASLAQNICIAAGNPPNQNNIYGIYTIFHVNSPNANMFTLMYPHVHFTTSTCIGPHGEKLPNGTGSSRTSRSVLLAVLLSAMMGVGLICG